MSKQETDLERRAMLGDRQAQRICTQLQIPLPCPCCGGDATWKSDTRRDGNCYYEVAWIECEKCRIRTSEIQVSNYYNGRQDPATALSRWNRRVVMQEQKEECKMSKFKDDVKLLSDLQYLIEEAQKTAYPPEYAKDVFGAISPVLKKVLPAARMKAIRQIDILSRAKNRLEELMEAEHETD